MKYRFNSVLSFSGKSLTDVVTYLYDMYTLQISKSTLQRRLRAWKVVVRSQTQDTIALRDRITELFFNGLNETQLLRTLQEENYQIGKYSLVRIRESWN
jgi:uncharacterized protein YktA (UPF0223 family)